MSIWGSYGIFTIKVKVRRVRKDLSEIRTREVILRRTVLVVTGEGTV